MSNVSKKYLVFNKKNGTLLATVPGDTDISQFDVANFLVKEVFLAPGQYYMGDYYTGQVHDDTVKPLITETEVRVKASNKVWREYPIHKQLNIIIDMLAQAGINKTQEFQKMIDYVNNVRKSTNLQIESYQNNKDAYNFLTRQEEMDLRKQAMDIDDIV